MTIVRATEPRHGKLCPTIALVIVLAPLAGCASGSSASFTQAPLLFAEQAAPVDPPASSQSSPDALPAPLLGGQAAVNAPAYIAVGGNAILPVGAVTAANGAVNGLLTQLASAAPLGKTPVSIQVSPARGVSLNTALPGASLGVNAGPSHISADVGLPIVTSVGLTGHLGVPGIAQPLVNGLGTSVASISTTPLIQPATAAVTPVTAALSNDIVTTLPILSGGPIKSPTPSGANLLTASAGNLVRICLLKGCR